MHTVDRSEFLKKSSNIYHSHKNRAKEKGAVLDFSLEQLRTWMHEALDTHCPYCRDRLDLDTISCDHRTPIARGGSFAEWNLEWICRDCNAAKGPLTGEEFDSLWYSLSEMAAAEARNNVLKRLRAGAKIVRGL